MSDDERAAQFAPFAALVGFGDKISESARYTEGRIILSESKMEELNYKLSYLLALEKPISAEICIFRPDGKKRGGRYVKLTDKILKYDAYRNIITLESCKELNIYDIIDIEF